MTESDFPYQFSLLVRRSGMNRHTKEEIAELSERDYRFLRRPFRPSINQSVYMELKEPGATPRHFFYDAAATYNPSTISETEPQESVFMPDDGMVATVRMGEAGANLIKMCTLITLFAGADQLGRHYGAHPALLVPWGAAVLGTLASHRGIVKELKKPTEKYEDRINVKITKEQYDAILKYLNRGKEKSGLYNLMVWNCSHYAGATAKRFGLPVPKNIAGFLNTVDMTSYRIRALRGELYPNGDVRVYSLLDRQRSPIYKIREPHNP